MNFRKRGSRTKSNIDSRFGGSFRLISNVVDKRTLLLTCDLSPLFASNNSSSLSSYDKHLSQCNLWWTSLIHITFLPNISANVTKPTLERQYLLLLVYWNPDWSNSVTRKCLYKQSSRLFTLTTRNCLWYIREILNLHDRPVGGVIHGTS